MGCTHIVKVEDEVQLADVLETSVEGFHKDLAGPSDVRQSHAQGLNSVPGEEGRTWIKSRIPSSLSLWSTTKTKYRVA